MHIELAVSCHQFQRRFCWMLSSLLQQTGALPKFTVNAAYIENTGDPSTAELLDYFQGAGLNVIHTPYADKQEFQYRGLVRNRQLLKSKADWIWFGDCDMAVHPEYVAGLSKLLAEHAGDGRMFYSGRFSTDKPSDTTDDIIGSMSYPYVVPEAYDVALKIPHHRKRNKGAGFCQIANVQSLRDNHGGQYVDPANNADYSWKRFSRCRSDTQFRRRLGRYKLDLPYFVHFQHRRDNEEGHHIEEQR